jgi:hypothetical protein
MTKAQGSVRIGPLSIFALIIILCLAVLSMLSLTSAWGEMAITERQEKTNNETYELEKTAQELVGAIDGKLAEVRGNAQEGITLESISSEAGQVEEVEQASASNPVIVVEPASSSEEKAVEAAVAALAAEGFVDGSVLIGQMEDPIAVDASLNENELTLVLSRNSGRTLTAVISISAEATYTVEQWSVTTDWVESETSSSDTLWLG